MKKNLIKHYAFFEPRVFISFLLLFGAVLLALGAFGISPVSKAQAQSPNRGRSAGQMLTVPFITMGTAPDIAQCRGILRQEIIDLVNSATVDPAEAFEINRRAHPHMIAMPPPTECASALWRAVRRGGKPTSSVD